jgi:hypothetical protein
MEVKKGQKTMTFNLSKLKGISKGELRDMCLKSSVFKDMLPKEREAKVRDVYANIPKTKESGKFESGKSVSGNSQPGRAKTLGSKQKSTSERADKRGTEDNSELSE